MEDIKKFASGSEWNSELQEKVFLQPFTYFRQNPGRGLIARWMRAFNYWIKVPANNFNFLLEVFGTMLDALLLIDDVEDNSTLRRGVPAAHLLYGVPTAINCSFYVILFVLKKLDNLGHPKAVNTFLSEIMKNHEGQGLDIYWRDNYICPTEEEYMAMAKKKSNLMGVIKVMQLFGDSKSDYTKLVETFTLYCQIRNDYCSIWDHTYEDRKISCDDITEGKFSFPIIHAIRSQPDDSQVMRILRMRTTDDSMKKYCVSLMEKCGTLKYTREVLTRLDKELREEIKTHGGNQMLETILDDIKPL